MLPSPQRAGVGARWGWDIIKMINLKGWNAMKNSSSKLGPSPLCKQPRWYLQQWMGSFYHHRGWDSESERQIYTRLNCMLLQFIGYHEAQWWPKGKVTVITASLLTIITREQQEASHNVHTIQATLCGSHQRVDQLLEFLYHTSLCLPSSNHAYIP